MARYRTHTLTTAVLALALGCATATDERHELHEDHGPGDESHEDHAQADEDEIVFELVPLQFASAPSLAQSLMRLVHNASEGASPTKIVADERTNSLLISGRPERIEELKVLIARLDVRSPRG